MNNFISWLGKNKLIATLLAIALYFCIVTFHDEVTTLAIKIRNILGRDTYNAYLAYAFLVLLIIYAIFLFYQSISGRQKYLKLILSVIVTALTIVAFRLLMVYNIEAIHFVEYMLVAIILIPVLRSYGETVFWVTILGILDELFQYRFLTPDFEYFDFNDCMLNLIGAGSGAVMIYITAGDVIDIRRRKWYKSPAILTGISLLAVFIILLITGKMTIAPVGIPGSENWFSLNRASMPDEFWKEAYPGRKFHVLRPFEAIILYYVLFASFFLLDFVSQARFPLARE